MRLSWWILAGVAGGVVTWSAIWWIPDGGETLRWTIERRWSLPWLNLVSLVLSFTALSLSAFSLRRTLAARRGEA